MGALPRVPACPGFMKPCGARVCGPPSPEPSPRFNVPMWPYLGQCWIIVFVCLRRHGSPVVCAVPLQMLWVITHPTPACKVGGPGRGFSCMLTPLGPPMGNVPPMVPIWGPPFLGMMWPCWPWPLRVPW